MSLHNVIHDQQEAESAEDIPRGSSLRDRARAVRAAASKTEKLDVSTYPGLIRVEYRLLSWQTLRKIRVRIEREVKDPGLRELYIACDQLIHACETVYEVKPDGHLEDLQVRWEPRLCDLLGIDGAGDLTPRQAVLKVFEVDTRVIGHWQEYVAWQQGAREEADEEVVGDLGETE